MTDASFTAADPPPATVRTVDVWRHPAAGWTTDVVAVEAPLEVRLNGHPFAVVMRTPGADRDLALGFLLTEGLLRNADEIRRVDVLEADQAVDVVFVDAQASRVAGALAGRRPVAMSSSCGLCGRASLASLAIDLPVCPTEWQVGAQLIGGLPVALLGVQSAFAATGGLHAAALFDLDGAIVLSAEDVGRHNAVDKLLGRMLLGGHLPLHRSMLMVSGRSSYEIVQKAWYGGVPFIAAVSAPSSLAVQLAHEAGITLLGFVRDGRFNVYAHQERVVQEQGTQS